MSRSKFDPMTDLLEDLPDLPELGLPIVGKTPKSPMKTKTQKLQDIPNRRIYNLHLEQRKKRRKKLRNQKKVLGKAREILKLVPPPEGGSQR